MITVWESGMSEIRFKILRLKCYRINYLSAERRGGRYASLKAGEGNTMVTTFFIFLGN